MPQPYRAELGQTNQPRDAPVGQAALLEPQPLDRSAVRQLIKGTIIDPAIIDQQVAAKAVPQRLQLLQPLTRGLRERRLRHRRHGLLPPAAKTRR